MDCCIRSLVDLGRVSHLYTGCSKLMMGIGQGSKPVVAYRQTKTLCKILQALDHVVCNQAAFRLYSNRIGWWWAVVEETRIW